MGTPSRTVTLSRAVAAVADSARGPLRTGDQSSGWATLAVPPELIELIASRVVELLATREPESAEPYLSVKQAAEYLAAPRSRIYELVERRRVAFHRDGRRLLFRRSDLDAVLRREEAR